MTDAPPPPPPFSTRQLPPENNLPNKIMTFAAIGMGVGFGTCSLAGLTMGGRSFGNYGVWVGATVFFVSLAILFLTGLYMIGAAIIRSFKR